MTDDTVDAMARTIAKPLGVDYDHAVQFPNHYEDQRFRCPNRALADQLRAAARAVLALPDV